MHHHELAFQVTLEAVGEKHGWHAGPAVDEQQNRVLTVSPANQEVLAVAVDLDARQFRNGAACEDRQREGLERVQQEQGHDAQQHCVAALTVRTRLHRRALRVSSYRWSARADAITRP